MLLVINNSSCSKISDASDNLPCLIYKLACICFLLIEVLGNVSISFCALSYSFLCMYLEINNEFTWLHSSGLLHLPTRSNSFSICFSYLSLSSTPYINNAPCKVDETE